MPGIAESPCGRGRDPTGFPCRALGSPAHQERVGEGHDNEEDAMTQVPRNWTVPVLMAAALVLSGTGCTSPQEPLPPVPSAALIGHWRGDCGATLDLARNGRFTFAGFPSGEGSHDERHLAGGGRWYLYRGGRNAPPPSLDLKYDRALFSLYFTRSSDGTVRGMHVDEEDRTCSFRRGR